MQNSMKTRTTPLIKADDDYKGEEKQKSKKKLLQIKRSE